MLGNTMGPEKKDLTKHCKCPPNDLKKKQAANKANKNEFFVRPVMFSGGIKCRIAH
jgi:hypothetical protein